MSFDESLLGTKRERVRFGASFKKKKETVLAPVRVGRQIIGLVSFLSSCLVLYVKGVSLSYSPSYALQSVLGGSSLPRPISIVTPVC